MTTTKVKMSDRHIALVVNEINKVLDEYVVFGQEWNKNVIKYLILSNLTKKTTLKLMEELNKLPISEWND